MLTTTFWQRSEISEQHLAANKQFCISMHVKLFTVSLSWSFPKISGGFQELQTNLMEPSNVKPECMMTHVSINTQASYVLSCMNNHTGSTFVRHGNVLPS
jgi:hypothetical protein